MMQLHLPWLELSILIPLAGALWVSRLRDAAVARKAALVFGILALVCTTSAWQDFYTLHVDQAHDRWDLISPYLGPEFLVIDALNAPLLPMAALLYLLTMTATAPTKIRRFSFSAALISEAILLSTLSCRDGWGLIVLLAVGTLPPRWELRARKKPTRVFAIHMALFVGLLAAGWSMVEWEGAGPTHSMFAVGLLVAAVLVRSGIAPLHCWMTDLFEHATFGTALLFVTPMVGAYAAVRLVLPIAPHWALHGIGFLSLATTVYAAGMALVQREARRFFCYLFLSHSALVLVGLEIATPIGLTGALCVWLSVGLALTGFGLSLRSLEARTGRLSLADYHGLYVHMPTLGSFFLLTGLASVGFPGTFGFVGTELLVEGAVEAFPLVGMAVVFATALNGVAVVRAYFMMFGGKQHVTTVKLRCLLGERWAIMGLALLILGGGLYPQPGVFSRHQAALEIMETRQALLPQKSHPHPTTIAERLP